MRSLGVVIVGLVVGCSSSSSPPPAAPPSEVAVAPVTAPAPITTKPEPAAAPAPSSSEKPSVLGERHPAGVEEPDPADSVKPRAIGVACTPGTPGCGKNGKVAMMVHRDRFGTMKVNDVCKPAKVSSALGSSPYETFACTREGKLAITKTCMMCRLPSGESLVGVIADMTSEQLAQAQAMAGFPASPALATEKAWSDAIKKAASNAPLP